MKITCRSCGKLIYIYLPKEINVNIAIEKGGNTEHECPHCGESYTTEEIERMAK